VVLELFSTSSIVRVIAAVAPFSADLISAEIQFHIHQNPRRNQQKNREFFADFFADGAVTGANTYTACV
jgi:hypothetical protein